MTYSSIIPFDSFFCFLLKRKYKNKKMIPSVLPLQMLSESSVQLSCVNAANRSCSTTQKRGLTEDPSKSELKTKSESCCTPNLKTCSRTDTPRSLTKSCRKRVTTKIDSDSVNILSFQLIPLCLQRSLMCCFRSVSSYNIPSELSLKINIFFEVFRRRSDAFKDGG